MARLYQFSQISSEQLLSVGYKAYHLSLVQQQVPIVPGVVVPADWLTATIATMDWSDPLLMDLPTSLLHLDLDDGLQLRAIAQHIRDRIAAAQLPEVWLAALAAAVAPWDGAAVILRPSLVVAPKAGQQVALQPEVVYRTASLMPSRVVGRDGAAIGLGLKYLWGDVFGAKSLFYWQQQNIPLYQLGVAVIVQPLLPAIASGTLTSQATKLEVAAVWGLGHGLSRGEVKPDLYHGDRETGALIRQTLGQKTIAYHLRSTEPTVAASTTVEPTAPGPVVGAVDWLAPYVLAEAQRDHYILSTEHWQSLLALSQRVTGKMGPLFTLEWVLAKTTEGDRLYVTQVTPPVGLRPLPESRPSASAQPGQVPPPGTTLVAQGVPASAGQVMAQAYVVEAIAALPPKIPAGAVLVAPTIPLPWLPLLEHVAAVVTQQGGKTSHSAIVARDLGIPAVMGVPGALHQISMGDWLWVDGTQGRIYRVAAPLQPAARLPQPPPVARRPDDLPLIRTRLMVNVHQLEQLGALRQWPLAGIGLLRSELLAMTVLGQHHPKQWLEATSRSHIVQQWAAAIAQFAQALPHQPVFYRAFDLRRREFPTAAVQSTEAAHSVLGIRGTLSYQLSPDLFRLELDALALVRAQGHHNVHLLLPFVRTVEEFQFCRQLVKQAGLTAQTDFQLWIMAEVPSVLLLLPEYVAAGVQGISIGTNDLTQLLLGVDRDDATMADLFEERHPAVQRAIAQLCKQAHTLGIPCSICGDAPVRHRELIQSLVRLGIDSISVPPTAVEDVFWEIVRAEHNLLSRTPSPS